MLRDSHPNEEMAHNEKRTSFWRKNKWFRWLAAGLLVTVALLAIVVDVLARRAEPFVRALVVQALSERFHARVELDSFHLSLGNSLHGEWGVWAQGHGLRIWSPAQAEGVAAPLPKGVVEPLFRLAEFRFHA